MRQAEGNPLADALALTRSVGTGYQAYRRDAVLNEHPAIAMDLARAYLATAERFDAEAAQQRLETLNQRLHLSGFKLSSTSEQRRTFARERASDCHDCVTNNGKTLPAYELIRVKAKTFTISLPELKSDDECKPWLARTVDKHWWQHKLKTVQLRALEEIRRDIGLVCKAKQCYSSDASTGAYRAQCEAMRDYLASQTITNEVGKSFSLLEVAASSTSNPVIRRTEMMVRMHGFEQVAKLTGHVAEFYTLTLPSRFHANHKSGEPVATWDGASIRAGNQQQCKAWARIRASLARKHINVYGVRVAEPHHDGTPHWHFLLFMEPRHTKNVRTEFSRYALQLDGHERGAAKHRFKAETIDPTRGSATGYIAKYISKNIDGAHLENDLHGNAAATAAERIRCWASRHGIRQFQFIGGPSVTVWRELRRCKEALPDDTAEAARLAADASDWAAYVLAMGGIGITRQERPVKPRYDFTESVDMRTGEITQNRQTKYGDAIRPSIRGLQAHGLQIKTRFHIWQRSSGAPNRDLVPEAVGLGDQPNRPHRGGVSQGGALPPLGLV